MDNPDAVARPLVQTSSTAPVQGPEIDYERALLRPRHIPARTGNTHGRILSPHEVTQFLAAAAASPYLAVDFETRGNDYSQGWIFMAGIGLAFDTGSCYLQWTEMGPTERAQIKHLLTTHRGLLAHNVYFDGGVLRTNFGSHGHFAACTLTLYRLLSNEGYVGQRHGLKEAMTDLLLWQTDNTDATDHWLVTRGYYKGNRRKDESPEALELGLREGKLRADKGELWRVPRDILGPYCILDAEATYLLYTQILRPAAEQFPALLSSFEKEWMYSVEIHIDQKLHGLRVDRALLEKTEAELQSRIADLTEKFLSHPEVAPAVAEIEKEMLLPLAEKEPSRYKKVKERPVEPPLLTKKGKPNKAHEKWLANAGKYLPQQSLNWENWKERYDLAASGDNPEYRFNINSGPQKVELLYRRLGYPVKVLTDTEGPSTAADAVRHMGEIGKILVERDEATKRLGFYTKYLELTETSDVIAPSFAVAGAFKTGRHTSSGPNIMQLPKSKKVMSLFMADEGETWGDLDFSALENVVAAELSECPNLHNLYGDGVPENDIHLYLVAAVPAWQAEAAATGYTQHNPPPGSVARAKKELKGHRSKAKSVVYACTYGGGVQKVYDTLANDGVEVTFEEVQEIHATYWKIFDRVKKYSYALEDEWWANLDLDDKTKEQYRYWSRSKQNRDRIPKGLASYVLNGLGRPMCVNYKNVKDLLSRVLQSTGHDILLMYQWIFGHELDAREIPWRPVVWDLHDALTVGTYDEHAEKLPEIYLYCMDLLNQKLGGNIRHRGVPVLGKNMAEVKEPESED